MKENGQVCTCDCDFCLIMKANSDKHLCCDEA